MLLAHHGSLEEFVNITVDSLQRSKRDITAW